VFGAAALALLTFLALNPAWWRDPLRMPGRVLDERSDLLNAQIESARAFGADYTNLGDRLAGLVDQIAFAGPQFYEVPVWQEFVGADIRAYRAAWYAGRGGGLIWGIPLLAVFGIGLVDLARRWRDDGAWIILFTFGVTALASLALIPFAWQRYYLWLCAPVAVIAGAGVGFMESLARRFA
jgi:4-amino-4-deoxy-L-arabinose transferase-like glycosyltransferase